MARWKEESPRARFMRKVRKDPSGCWIWQGSSNGRYGCFYRGREFGGGYAHREAYRIFQGPIPEGMQVCHRCDVPLCVNPAHLFLGSPADNSADAVSKGRIARGEDAGPSKLTWKEVRAIRRAFPATELAIRETAHRYGVARRTIYRIVRGETWKEESAAVSRYRRERRNPNKGPRRSEVSA